MCVCMISKTKIRIGEELIIYQYYCVSNIQARDEENKTLFCFPSFLLVSWLFLLFYFSISIYTLLPLFLPPHFNSHSEPTPPRRYMWKI